MTPEWRRISAALSVAVMGASVGCDRAHDSAALPGIQADVAVVVDAGRALDLLSKGSGDWRVVSRIPVKRGIRSVSWMPGNRTLVISTAGSNLSNELEVIDLNQRAERTLATTKLSTRPMFFESVAWSPEGRRIAVTRSSGLYGADVEVVDASNGSVIRSFRALARSDSGLGWSKDGANLYFSQQQSNRAQPKLHRLVVSTGRVIPVAGVRGLDPSMRSDGALFFTADDGIRVLENGEEKRIRGTKRGDRFPAWLKNGNLLLVERPALHYCPRQIAETRLCSHVVAVRLNDAAPHYVTRTLARNPATR